MLLKTDIEPPEIRPEELAELYLSSVYNQVHKMRYNYIGSAVGRPRAGKSTNVTISMCLLDKTFWDNMEDRAQIKNYIRLMKPYMDKTTINELENLHTKMLENVKAVQEGPLPPADKEKRIIDVMYEAFDSMMVYGIDALQYSKIIQKQVEGILLTGKTIEEMQAVGLRVRGAKGIAEIKEREGEEFEEGFKE